MIGPTNFEGYESGTALRKDFQMDVKHRNDFRALLLSATNLGRVGSRLEGPVFVGNATF